MPTIVRINADIIGSGELAKEPGGQVRISTLRETMHSFLDGMLRKLSKGREVKVIPLEKRGDNAPFALQGDIYELVSIAVIAAWNAFVESKVGHDFRFTLFHLEDPGNGYHPRVAAFENISKDLERGSKYHLAVEEWVITRVNQLIGSWFADKPKERYAVKFEKEPEIGCYFDLFCKIGDSTEYKPIPVTYLDVLPTDLGPEEQQLLESSTPEEQGVYLRGRERGFDLFTTAKVLGMSRDELSEYIDKHVLLKKFWDEGRKRDWMTRLEHETAKLPPSIRALVEKSRQAGQGFPLVIPRRLLEHRLLTEFVPQAAFRILLVFPRLGGQETVKITQEKIDGEMFCALRVDLTDQRVGIYNNDGKRFLRREFNLEDKATKDLLYKASKQVHRLLMERPHSNEEKPLSWRQLTGGLDLPFRWTSGGILAITEYKGREWAVLFFRDIPPVGWNVGNGAASDPDELTDLDLLIGREFAEELILLDRLPRPGPVGAIQFTFIDTGKHSPLNPERHNVEELTEFMRTHAKLRIDHDQIKIEINPDRSGQRLAERIHSVKHYPVDVSDEKRPFRAGDVIWSLNPLECGIEAIRLYRFKMNDPEWLVDGELFPAPWSPAKWLIRRPVILFSLDFLREQFKNGGNSFGEVFDTEGSEECKTLAEVPKEGKDFILFVDFEGNDIDLRERRLLKIDKDLREQQLVKEFTGAQEGLRSEVKQIRKWLDGKEPDEKGYRKPYEEGFREPFRQVQRDKMIAEPRLRTLCPVTWKTLELAFQNKYL